jgi:hypothetical protein
MSNARLPAGRALTRAVARLFATAVVGGGLALGASAAAAPANAATPALTIHPCCQLLPHVSLTYNPTFLYYWESTTLTATTNFDVGPTPYFIGLYDVTDGTWVKECPTGTTCSVTVSDPTWPSPTSKVYRAVVGLLDAPPGSSGVLVSSAPVTVLWTTIR